MEYNVEDVTPVEKKIDIKIAPDEVDAAISGEVALHKDLKLDGFRKGKVPPNIIEQRLHETIYSAARDSLINVHLNDIIQQLKLRPVSGLKISGVDKPLERGKEYDYTVRLEVLPEFQLPVYEGLEVAQEKTNVTEQDMQAAYDRLLKSKSKLIPVEGNAPGKDGQFVNVDFQAFEDGKPVEGLNITNFDFELGAGEALPDFEKLVKGIPVGNTSEEIIHFPDDFLVSKLAGKDLLMRVTVNAVKERQVPELTEEFAKSNGYKSLDSLKELMTKSYTKLAENMHKAAAQRKLLDQMLKQSEFPVPQSMVQLETEAILMDMNASLENQGRNLNSLGKTKEQLEEEVRPQAEAYARAGVLLLAIARAENLEVTEQEIAAQIMRRSIESGVPYQDLLKDLENSGMFFQFRDKLLADKAMDLVYARAKVNMVEPAKAEEQEKSEQAASEQEAPAQPEQTVQADATNPTDHKE